MRENIVLGLQTKRGWLSRLSRDEQERLAQEMIKALGIATPDADKPVGQLSGGNQQKVVLARSLVSGPSILILDEPTRGIDVGAHAEIVALIRKLCARGPRVAGGVFGAGRARRGQRPDRGAARPAEDRRDRRRRHHPRDHHPHHRGRTIVTPRSNVEAETAALLRAPRDARFVLRPARACRPSRGLAASGAGAHPCGRRLHLARVLHTSASSRDACSAT